MPDPLNRALPADPPPAPKPVPVVVGVDFSDGAANALRFAQAHAHRTGAPLHVVHVVDPDESRLHDDVSCPDQESFQEAIHLALQSYVRRIVGPLTDLQTVVCTGEPGAELEAYRSRIGAQGYHIGQTGRGESSRQRWIPATWDSGSRP
ncbi:hypothetical protein BH23VER1_BH23VER1_28800 [soil metagenome]